MQVPTTPCPKRLHHYDFMYSLDTYVPRSRRDLSPIFELVAEFDIPELKQKAYYGKLRNRLPKADI